MPGDWADGPLHRRIDPQRMEGGRNDAREGGTAEQIVRR